MYIRSQPGVRVLLVVHENVTGGTKNKKKCSKEALLGKFLIWGYVKGI